MKNDKNISKVVEKFTYVGVFNSSLKVSIWILCHGNDFTALETLFYYVQY